MEEINSYAIPGPAFLVVVSDNILIVRVGMLCEIALNQIPRLLSSKPEKKKTLYNPILHLNYRISFQSNF
jgi:hypothetical protein